MKTLAKHYMVRYFSRTVAMAQSRSADVVVSHWDDVALKAALPSAGKLGYR